jgi:hypothetical protein
MHDLRDLSNLTGPFHANSGAMEPRITMRNSQEIQCGILMPMQPRSIQMLPLAPLKTSTTIGSQTKRSNRTDTFLNYPSKYYVKLCRRRGAIRNLNTPNRILVPTRQLDKSPFRKFGYFFSEVWEFHEGNKVGLRRIVLVASKGNHDIRQQ